uniref:Uncharacterized protein n=1 Tax=Arundo donax TaxID=35708 RepID=A0A0A9BQ92_ARUDO
MLMCHHTVLKYRDMLSFY